MARHLSEEEARAQYEAAMGQELGTFFAALWRECAWLHVPWAEYRELFGVSPERVALLDGAARLSFNVIHDALLEMTFLHLCRLTDPPTSAGRSNLILRRPPLLVAPPIRESTERYLASVLTSTDFARDWRNRRIAHADLALALGPITPLAAASRQQVADALGAMTDLLNHVQLFSGLGVTNLDPVAHDGGALSLLHVLRDGLAAQTAQRRRLEEGRPLPKDLVREEPL